MAPSSSTAFPLEVVTSADLKQLCEVLWDWETCFNCKNAESTLGRCRMPNCSWGQRSERLGPFFDFYCDITSSYVPDFFSEESQALRNHQDLFDIIRLLRQCGNNNLSRQDCRLRYFSLRGKGTETLVPESDQDRAFELAANIMAMTVISSVANNDQVLQISAEEEGQQPSLPVSWSPSKSLRTCIEESFPSRVHPSLQPGDIYAEVIRTTMTAENLTKIARLKIEGTTNLHGHLKLNQTTGTIQLFHHTSFLKEHLLATKHTPGEDKQHIPSLPRELALETLYTLQLLFPRQPKSQSILRNLVSKQGFDPDCLRFGTAAFELPDERKSGLCFSIWGTRLMDLYDEIENPKPRGILDAWLERKSKSRHIMLATLLGVFMAVLLGVLSLFVSVFQTWIAWQEWKESSKA